MPVLPSNKKPTDGLRYCELLVAVMQTSVMLLLTTILSYSFANINSNVFARMAA